MAKKWLEKVIQRSFMKEHSFVNRLYIQIPNTFFGSGLELEFGLHIIRDLAIVDHSPCVDEFLMGRPAFYSAPC